MKYLISNHLGVNMAEISAFNGVSENISSINIENINIMKMKWQCVNEMKAKAVMVAK
jgi:hypothetical protein